MTKLRQKLLSQFNVICYTFLTVDKYAFVIKYNVEFKFYLKNLNFVMNASLSILLDGMLRVVVSLKNKYI